MSHIVPSVSVTRVDTSTDLKTFLDLPFTLYRTDTAWRAPLRLERKEQLDPNKNPAARHLVRELFLARRGNKVVGRIAAFTNPKHDSVHDAETAFFGYFDAVDDAFVMSALFDAVDEFAVRHNRSRVVGPAQWGVNEEVGLLVDGFDHPNVVLMPYGKSHYPGAVEAAGYSKAVDMLAFQADLEAGFPRPKMSRMMQAYAERSPSVDMRRLNPKAFTRDIELAMEVFNDAWSNNWGFLPFGDEDIQHLAKELKPLIQADLFRITYIDGEVAAFLCMLPDLNELVRGFDGKLLPLNWAKLIYRLKFGQINQARIPLMGLKRKFHGTRKGLASVAAMCEDVFAVARAKGYTHCELSWILEDNEGMIAICKQADAKHYKTYRMYEKRIG